MLSEMSLRVTLLTVGLLYVIFGISLISPRFLIFLCCSRARVIHPRRAPFSNLAKAKVPSPASCVHR